MAEPVGPSAAEAKDLESGYKWAGGTVTFSFPTADFGDGTYTHTSFRAFDSYWQATVRAIFSKISEVANINFVEVASGAAGDIRLGMAAIPVAGNLSHAYPPGSGKGGDVWINLNDPAVTLGSAPGEGGERYWLLFHEILHAVGLEHPEIEVSGDVKHSASIPAARATQEYTIEAYTRSAILGNRPTDLQLYDIAALQDLYGARASHTGNDVYQGWTVLTKSIWDSGGTDTLSAAGTNLDAVVDLREGEFSSIAGAALVWTTPEHVSGESSSGRADVSTQLRNISIAYGSVIENAIGGGGNDTLIGNAVANVLNGDNGNDTISGNDGNDTLNGGNGGDTLDGGDGNDHLDGGVGSDTMTGGAGDDVFVVADDGDVVVESAAGGTDLVLVGVSEYYMTDNVENLLYIGEDNLTVVAYGNGLDNEMTAGAFEDVLSGGGGNDTLYGNEGDDFLYGEDGNDILIGGAGPDVMEGGAGADIFRFAEFDTGLANSADYITDFAHGTDKIDLSEIDANAWGLADQRFDFIGTGAFSGNAGELHYRASGGETFVEGDIDGDGHADFAIVLVGAVTLTASDFIL